jgi:hypothetical protein
MDESNDNAPYTDISPIEPPPVDLDALIVDLAAKQTLLSRYIDRSWPDLDTRQLAKLLSTHGQNASRLARLLLDRSALYGKPPDPLKAVMDQALHLAGIELGVELIDPATLTQDEHLQPPIDLDDVIFDLCDKQNRLSAYLDRCCQDPDDKLPPSLFTVYGQNAARLGRLLRAHRALYGEIPDELATFLEQAIAAEAQSQANPPASEEPIYE